MPTSRGGGVQFHIAHIYLKEDLYENALGHFRKELKYPKEIGIFPLIAKSSNHLFVVFMDIEEKLVREIFSPKRTRLPFLRDESNVPMAWTL